MNLRTRDLRLPLVLCLAVGTAVALLPTTARAQADGANRTTAGTFAGTGRGTSSLLGHAESADRADHSGHAHLHRTGAVEVAMEIVALKTLEPLDHDAEALCRAARLALTAGLQPLRERIRTANHVQALTDRILALDPDHAGGLHLRGQLGAAAMRLSPIVRFTVEKLLGSNVVGQASWESAERDFRRAIAREPHEPSHRIELARLLRDTGRPDAARAELEGVLAVPGDDAITRHYRQVAGGDLSAIR